MLVLPRLPGNFAHLPLRKTALWAAGAVALVAGALVVEQFVSARAPSPALQARARLQAAEQERCVEGAMLAYDVHWAATCTRLAERGQGDGHADCELPPAEVDRLDGLLRQAEQRCVADWAIPAAR